MDLTTISLSIYNACVMVTFLFGICGISQRISDAFAEINDGIVQLDWYLFPDQLNRMLPTILMATQGRVELKCFGSIGSNWETFIQVRFLMELQSLFWFFSNFDSLQIAHTSYSNFMVLRKFGQ